jgi:predicted ATPase with chaperone activity
VCRSTRVGVIEDRLIEVLVEPATLGPGIWIFGLPENRRRTTADPVRAALVNSALVGEAPSVAIRLEPAVRRPTSDLDLAIALATLIKAGHLATRLRWILATGRLGLDGTVHAPGLADRPGLADIVGALCRTHGVESEPMFEEDSK